jgi:hypothetical protein
MTTEGERWARDQLRAVRAARYRPAAGWRFLAASLERAATVRRMRPALARQSRRWAAAGLAGPDGEPFERLSAADAASLARIALVPFVASARPRRGPFVALVAAAT